MGYDDRWILNLSSEDGWAFHPEITNGWNLEERRLNLRKIADGGGNIVIARVIRVVLVDQDAPAEVLELLRGMGRAVITPPTGQSGDFGGIEAAIEINNDYWSPDEGYDDGCPYCGAKFNSSDRVGWDCPYCGCN